MKLKPTIGIALAMMLVVVLAGLWVWFHGAASSQVETARAISPKLVSPNVAASQAIPFHTVKLVTVTAKSSTAQSIKSGASVKDESAVQVIVDTSVGYQERLNAISSLSGHLTENDWKVLQQFLLKPDEMDKGQLGQVIKNELLDTLCALNPPPTDLGDVLTQMYRDQQQNEVVRDYAVQHLTPYYEQMAAQPDNAKTTQSLQDILWEAVNETSDSIGGTALLALNQLSQQYPGFDQGKIATTALQMANDNSASELTHITAYQVCAQMGTADALPVVLQAAQNGETVSVRMSAIGALGQLGGSEQIPFLNSVLAGTEERLKPVAQHALETITTRQTRLALQK
jgi:hypothetical protein